MNGVDDRAWLESRPWIDHSEADILAYVRGLDRDPGFDLLGKLEHWRLDGFVIFKQAVSKTLIDEFLEDIEYLRRHRHRFDLSVEIKGRHVPISECAVGDLDKQGTKLNNLIPVSLGSRIGHNLSPLVGDSLVVAADGRASGGTEESVLDGLTCGA